MKSAAIVLLSAVISSNLVAQDVKITGTITQSIKIPAAETKTMQDSPPVPKKRMLRLQ